MFVSELKAFARKTFGSSAVELLKSARSGYRQLQRQLVPLATKKKLVAQLRKAGVEAGDTLVVHTSLGRLGNVEGGARTVVEALQETVGPAGNLLMPSYVGLKRFFEARQSGNLVDLRKDPGTQGSVPETFRKMEGVRRSSHPFSSVCAWGRDAEFLASGHQLDPRICHTDSPLGRLLQLKGKVLGLGVDMGPISFYHVVEDTWAGFPFDPYGSAVPARYYDAQGQLIERSVRVYRTELPDKRIDSDAGLWVRKLVEKHFDRASARSHFSIGHGRGWMIQANLFYDNLKTLAEKGLTIYTTKEEWGDRGI